MLISYRAPPLEAGYLAPLVWSASSILIFTWVVLLIQKRNLDIRSLVLEKKLMDGKDWDDLLAAALGRVGQLSNT